MKEDKFRESVTRIVPRYAILPLISMVVLNFSVYYLSGVIIGDAQRYDFSIWLDEKVVFAPIFIIPYILAYVQWISGYILIGRESKDLCYKIITAEMITKVLVGITFFVFPTAVTRPEIDLSTNNPWCWLTGFIYSCDVPINVFPSIHCIESLFCFIGAMGMAKGGWRTVWKWVMGIMTVFVCLSTVYVKQHVVVDIAGAFVYVAVGLLITAIIFRIKNRK